MTILRIIWNMSQADKDKLFGSVPGYTIGDPDWGAPPDTDAPVVPPPPIPPPPPVDPEESDPDGEDDDDEEGGEEDEDDDSEGEGEPEEEDEDEEGGGSEEDDDSEEEDPEDPGEPEEPGDEDEEEPGEPLTPSQALIASYPPGIQQLHDCILNNGDTPGLSTNIWRDLIGINNVVMTSIPTWDPGCIFDGALRGRFEGVITPIYTISTTVEVHANDIYHPRLFSDHPYPTIYLYLNSSFNDKSISLFAHGKDTRFIPRIALPLNQKCTVTIVFTNRPDGPDGLDGNNKVRLYVNGQYHTFMDVGAVASGTPVAGLGGRPNTNDRNFRGKIFNFMRYDRALSAEEVQAIYDIDSTRF